MDFFVWLFFVFCSSRLENDEQKAQPFENKKKRTEILIGLMFFNDFIDRVLCAFRTVTANILLRSFHTWSKGKSLFSV